MPPPGAWPAGARVHPHDDDPHRAHRAGVRGRVPRGGGGGGHDFQPRALAPAPGRPPGEGGPPGRAGHAGDLPPGVGLEGMGVADLRGILPLNGSSGPP